MISSAAAGDVPVCPYLMNPTDSTREVCDTEDVRVCPYTKATVPSASTQKVHSDDDSVIHIFSFYNHNVYLRLRLFLYKVVLVVLLSFGIFPLLLEKNKFPAYAYTGGLVFLHIAILFVYCWRVRCSEFGKAFFARFLGLLICTGLLMVVAQAQEGPEKSKDIPLLILYTVLLCTVHALILFLIMAVVTRPLKSQKVTEVEESLI
eukprot:g3793.t1